ncbi:MAG: rod shape-determining protein MreC [Acidobacteriota bacterium]|nr:rod shape-determining protein MreC [Acidobacteriota bacterium]MDE2921977.1 rod shape-determining protein MreC [Acidobacteriota bacterium]MDE3265741.1 rod shape-determining protein MreC [Acidobacteriota bacterium]
MSERRVAILFAVAVTLLLASLTAQSPERAGDVALWVEAPAKRLVGAVVDVTNGVRERWRTRARLERENDELRSRLRELEAAHAAALGAELEVDLLSEPLGYARPANPELLLADVVSVDYHSWRRSAILRLPRGNAREEWARRPVTTVDGLLGRVVSAGGDYARVLLVTDRDSSVGAMIERTRRQGIVRGTEEAGVLSLAYVPVQVDVRPGDRVVTAGIDGVFPRGIPIGTVTSVESSGDQFHEIRVAPRVDLGSLSHAFIWRRDPVPEAVMDGADAVGR